MISGWDGKEKVELNVCKSEMAFSILGSNIWFSGIASIPPNIFMKQIYKNDPKII